MIEFRNGASVGGPATLNNSGTIYIGPNCFLLGAALNNTGTIDVSGALAIEYNGSSPIQSLRSQIISGYANGAWNGARIEQLSVSSESQSGCGIRRKIDAGNRQLCRASALHYYSAGSRHVQRRCEPRRRCQHGRLHSAGESFQCGQSALDRWRLQLRRQSKRAGLQRGGHKLRAEPRFGAARNCRARAACWGDAALLASPSSMRASPWTSPRKRALSSLRTFVGSDQKASLHYRGPRGTRRRAAAAGSTSRRESRVVPASRSTRPHQCQNRRVYLWRGSKTPTGKSNENAYHLSESFEARTWWEGEGEFVCAISTEVESKEIPQELFALVVGTGGHVVIFHTHQGG